MWKVLGRIGPVFEVAAPVAASVLLLMLLGEVWMGRLAYPFDLEWMEGGMLAHAWRVANNDPLYILPTPEFVPFVYPPGYASVVAILGKVFGLSLTLGRLVSLLGSLAAAGAVSFVVLRSSPDREITGSTRLAALVAAATFLGTYPHSGAFFDLVRPDGLFLGLLAWAIALSFEDRPGLPVTAGVLLFLSFLMKHNAAAFVVPLTIGLWMRGGWRPAASFVAAFAIPAVLTVAYLDWRNEGRFLLYLIAVPASHPSEFARVWPGMPREFGTPLPIATATITAAFFWLAIRGQDTLPRAITTFVPVAVGMVAGGLGSYVPPPPGSGLMVFPSAIAFFAIGAVPVAAMLYALGWSSDQLAGDEARHLVGWRGGMAIGVASTALVLGAVMRAHNGGFVNVHLPWFWVIAVGFGVVLSRMVHHRPTPAVRTVVTVLATGQLLWAISTLDRDRLMPNEADEALGIELVKAAGSGDGPVLSPFAAWLPVYAGKAPSLHYMGLWDLEYKNGPFYAETKVIQQAIDDGYWSVVLLGNQRFGPYRFSQTYDTRRTYVESANRAMMPKTGWMARPTRQLVLSEE